MKNWVDSFWLSFDRGNEKDLRNLNMREKTERELKLRLNWNGNRECRICQVRNWRDNWKLKNQEEIIIYNLSIKLSNIRKVMLLREKQGRLGKLSWLHWLKVFSKIWIWKRMRMRMRMKVLMFQKIPSQEDMLFQKAVDPTLILLNDTIWVQ